MVSFTAASLLRNPNDILSLEGAEEPGGASSGGGTAGAVVLAGGDFVGAGTGAASVEASPPRNPNREPSSPMAPLLEDGLVGFSPCAWRRLVETRSASANANLARVGGVIGVKLGHRRKPRNASVFRHRASRSSRQTRRRRWPPPPLRLRRGRAPLQTCSSWAAWRLPCRACLPGPGAPQK